MQGTTGKTAISFAIASSRTLKEVQMVNLGGLTWVQEQNICGATTAELRVKR